MFAGLSLHHAELQQKLAVGHQSYHAKKIRFVNFLFPSSVLRAHLMQASIPGLSPSFLPCPLCLAGLCLLLSTSQPCSQPVPCLQWELLLQAPPLQQLLHNRGKLLWADSYPPACRRWSQAACSPAKEGQATCPALGAGQEPCTAGVWLTGLTGRAAWARSIGLLQAQGPSQLLGLPVPKAGSAGLLY